VAAAALPEPVRLRVVAFSEAANLRAFETGTEGNAVEGDSHKSDAAGSSSSSPPSSSLRPVAHFLAAAAADASGGDGVGAGGRNHRHPQEETYTIQLAEFPGVLFSPRPAALPRGHRAFVGIDRRAASTPTASSGATPLFFRLNDNPWSALQCLVGGWVGSGPRHYRRSQEQRVLVVVVVAVAVVVVVC
jgi:hypothetical protein